MRTFVTLALIGIVWLLCRPTVEAFDGNPNPQPVIIQEDSP